MCNHVARFHAARAIEFDGLLAGFGHNQHGGHVVALLLHEAEIYLHNRLASPDVLAGGLNTASLAGWRFKNAAPCCSVVREKGLFAGRRSEYSFSCCSAVRERRSLPAHWFGKSSPLLAGGSKAASVAAWRFKNGLTFWCAVRNRARMLRDLDMSGVWLQQASPICDRPAASKPHLQPPPSKRGHSVAGPLSCRHLIAS